MVYVATAAADILAALHHTPLLQAHYVTPAWAAPQNGIIEVPEFVPAESQEAHCTLLQGLWLNGVGNRFPSLNSWGTDWGRDGEFVMDERTWRALLMQDHLVTAQLGPMWANWRGWQEFIVEDLGLPEDEQ